jgi:O-succinylbenzoic acid--CoA ligase
MPRLVAVAATGPAFVDRLRDIWAAGDAVLPVDPRLPAPARARLLADLAPHLSIEADGTTHSLTDGRTLTEARPTDEGDALVLATSGSTGEPKGVVLTHQAVAASAVATSARLGVDPEGDRWLACLPLAHVGGLSVVTRALATGTGLVVHDGFEAAAVEAEARRGVTLVSLVATALRRIDASLFRLIVLGGSAPPAGLPANVVTTYGLTETGSGVVYDGFPLDGVGLRIIDGEIHLRGPMLLRAYRGGPAPFTADGWFPTGDAGRIEADGRLTVIGRRGDMIITGGENVWPSAVEDVLATHPAVGQVAVAGRPDPEWGQRVVAFVVPTAAAAPPTLAALRAYAADRLPAYAAPRQLVLLDALPRTALGKVVRHRLPDDSA